MNRKQRAIFIAGRAARIILRGGESGSLAPDYSITDIIASNLVVREDAENGLVGYLYVTGGNASVTFSIISDPDGIFAIVNGNELHKVDAFGTGADYQITIRAVDTAGADYSETFTVDVIPTGDAEGDTGIGGGGGSGDVEYPDDEDPDADTDPYIEPPVEVVTEVAARVSGKTGGTSVFLKDWGVPVAGRAYVMKYEADWSGMSAQGRYAAVGFGLKQGNSFHMVGLRGNGATMTTMLASRLYGDWRKSKQFTITNDGAAENGTRTGPNWLRLTIGGDGTTYTLETSADGNTWDVEIEDAAPSPFTDATDATQFGPAAYFYEEDKGAFVISITEFWQKPVFTVDPVITGDPVEGETLTVDNGTVIGAGITYTRQWKADGVAISGETGSTLLLTEEEIGADITADVTATNPGGATTATSAAVGPVEAAIVTGLQGSADAGILAAVHFTYAASTVTVVGQKNVDSVTRLTTGKYRIAFASTLSTNNYGLLGGGRWSDAADDDACMIGINRNSTSGYNSYSTTQVDIICHTSRGTVFDPGTVSVVIFDPSAVGSDYLAGCTVTVSGTTPTVQLEKNVGSAPRQATGVYTPTFTSALSDSDYSVFGSTRYADFTNDSNPFFGYNRNSTGPLNRQTTALVDLSVGALCTAVSLQNYEPGRFSVLVRNSDTAPRGTVAAVRFTVSGGVCTIVKSWNVSSLTYQSAGLYRVNFTTPIDDTDYMVIGAGKYAGAAGTNEAMAVGLNRNNSAPRNVKSTTAADVIFEAWSGTGGLFDVEVADLWFVKSWLM